MDKTQFINDVKTHIKRIERQLPSEESQYADEDTRIFYANLRSLIRYVNAYKSELELSAKEKAMWNTGLAKEMTPDDAADMFHGNDKSTTRETNVGQSNYAKKAIQPWDIWIEYGLNPWDADIIKRILRTKDDPGMSPEAARILDYEKVKHICNERIDQINAGEPHYANLKIPSWVEESND